MKLFALQLVVIVAAWCSVGAAPVQNGDNLENNLEELKSEAYASQQSEPDARGFVRSPPLSLAELALMQDLLGQLQYAGAKQGPSRLDGSLKTNGQLNDELTSGVSNQLHALGLAAQEVPLSSLENVADEVSDDDGWGIASDEDTYATEDELAEKVLKYLKSFEIDQSQQSTLPKLPDEKKSAASQESGEANDDAEEDDEAANSLADDASAASEETIPDAGDELAADGGQKEIMKPVMQLEESKKPTTAAEAYPSELMMDDGRDITVNND
ncbi:PREDICTED: uncharacterized protein LOC106804638 [Priapulus caudatus]|uniref:Uncharacterized protein LOC106804638 n=1 Tax=Priapulus caudatus TaxID=37621 RepID=A0ABM1DN71_PRICU|nr:PREDICTED: uncharacterized protein LOC106804638 [Priapulus caudatus]